MRLERAIKRFNEKKESKKVKKLIMIAGLAASLVLGSALSAMAANPLPNGTGTSTTGATYQATPAGTTIENGKYPGTQAPNYYGYEAKQNVPGGAPSTTGDSTVPMGTNGATGQKVTRIHSNYAKNTNACASCHATHTAVGDNLLQWEGETPTCMACHDGSAGVATYDVSNGLIGTSSKITNGGLFPQNVADSTINSKSMHDVFGDGTTTLAAAPGGNFGTTNTSTTRDSGKWEKDFTCVSCHSPHANGGNFRILEPNVNGFADLHTSSAASVNYISWTTVAAPGTSDGKQFAVKAQYTDYNNAQPFYAYLMTAPHGYEVDVTTGGTAITSGFTVDNSAGYTVVKFDAAPGGTVSIDGKVALKVKGNIDGYLTEAEKVTYVNGFSDFCGACHTDYNTANTSTTSVTNGYGDRTFTAINNKTNAGDWKQLKDPAGNALYADPQHTIKAVAPSHAVSVLTGTFSSAYRHTVGLSAGADGHGASAYGLPFEQRVYYTSSGTPSTLGDMKFLSCLTCHVAHGTDNKWWTAYSEQRGYDGFPSAASISTTEYNQAYVGPEVFDTTNGTNENGVQINTRGSNLKRMPNMGMCEACHGKAPASEGYNISTNAN
ncbi:MAG TPA: cytochrome c3 family protein [Desulfobacteria bacterium]|nr:cytochrome c3 family protein [Desulfobacteria bacterium]